MSLTDVLLAVGLVPTVYIAYWLLRGLLLTLTNPTQYPVSVTLRAGGPYIPVALLFVLAAVAGAVLTLAS